MFDWIERFINSPLVRRYRKRLGYVALCLGFFQVAAFLLSLFFAGQPWVANLVQYARDLMTLTLGVLMVFAATFLLESMYSTDAARRDEIYDFIQKNLQGWNISNLGIEPTTPQLKPDGTEHRFTHFKAYRNDAPMTDPRLKALYENVHFELTVYPTKLIYGLHFELEDPYFNSAMLEAASQMLELNKLSGFKIDHKIPKKAGWRFFIRTIPLKSDSKHDAPLIITHARHFVELVGHGHPILYGEAMRSRYSKMLERQSDPQLVPPGPALGEVLASALTEPPEPVRRRDEFPPSLPEVSA